jgi:hypothetical protein
MSRRRLPTRTDLRSIAARVRERARRRRLWHNYYLGMLPPKASSFKAWGAGTIVMPPVRVEAAECIELGRNVRIHENAWLCVKPQPGLVR